MFTPFNFHDFDVSMEYVISNAWIGDWQLTMQGAERGLIECSKAGTDLASGHE